MPKIVKTEGFILHTFPFKESSLIVSVLTRSAGRIKVLTKGARRPRSKFCGTMELFNLDEIIYYKRERKEIYTLSDAVVLNHFEKLRRDPKRVNGASVLCEFFEKSLAMEQPSYSAFSLVDKFLRRLETIPQRLIKPLVLVSLLKGLRIIGFMPHLTSCVHCKQKIEPGPRVQLSISGGGVVCSRDYDDTVVFLSGQAYQTLIKIYKNQEIQFSLSIFDEIEKFVTRYLGYHFNRLVLNSLKFL